LQYSDNRTSHTAELTISECNRLIGGLQGKLVVQPKPVDMLKRKRSIVLNLAVKAGFVIENKGNGKEVDYVRFNKFMLERSVLKKKFSAYTVEELDGLITQFKMVVKHNTGFQDLQDLKQN
jgi:hypothetical protein